MRRTLILISILLFTCCSVRGQWVKSKPAYSDYGYDAIVSIGQYLVTICGGEVFLSTNLGNTWLPSENDLIDFTYLYKFHDRLFAMNLYGDSRIIYSDDSGVSWLHVKGIYNSGTAMIGFHDTLLAIGGNICRSFDSGLTWHFVTPGPGMPFNWDTVPRSVTTSSDRLYVAGSGGVFRSSDGGSNWINILHFGPPSGGVGDTVGVSIAVLDSSIFVGTFVRNRFINTTFVSRDYGVTWDTIPFASLARCLRIVNGVIFAGLDSNLMISKDTGRTWYSILSNIGPDRINWIDTALGYVLVAGQSGLWRRPLSEILAQSVVHELLGRSTLLSIYPNPTTTSTTISIAPIAPGYAEISIVNMLGQIVAHVYSGMLDASEHHFTWETQAKACATGVYQCVVRMNGGVQTVPIVVE